MISHSGIPTRYRPCFRRPIFRRFRRGRQIGATGGTEIRIDGDVDVEQGNGGYRFRLNLLGIYPDQARIIPMYCRATPEKIVELTFG